MWAAVRRLRIFPLSDSKTSALNLKSQICLSVGTTYIKNVYKLCLGVYVFIT